MEKSHRNYYLAITNVSIVPVKTIDEARSLANGKPGGLVKGFDSYQEAVDAIPSIRAEIKRRLSKKKQKFNRNGSYQLKTDMSHLKAFLPEYQLKKTKLTLSCRFGGKSFDSSVAGSNGVTETVLLTSGASAQLKYLELAYAALKWAERVINQGTDSVVILGVDSFVLVTLTDWAPKSRDRGWVNSFGKPMANREIIEPMLALFEKLGDKVQLNTGKQPVDTDAPF